MTPQEKSFRATVSLQDNDAITLCGFSGPEETGYDIRVYRDGEHPSECSHFLPRSLTHVVHCLNPECCCICR